MALERKLAIENGAKEDAEGFVSVSCSYDIGWQKRSKGHNSSTGNGAVLRLKASKVMDYTTRTKKHRISRMVRKWGIRFV